MSFIGALVVGILGVLYSRIFGGTTVTTTIPGILFLVPCVAASSSATDRAGAASQRLAVSYGVALRALTCAGHDQQDRPRWRGQLHDRRNRRPTHVRRREASSLTFRLSTAISITVGVLLSSFLAYSISFNGRRKTTAAVFAL